MFHDEAVEEAFDCCVRSGELLVYAEDGFVSSRVIMLSAQVERVLLTEDNIDELRHGVKPYKEAGGRRLVSGVTSLAMSVEEFENDECSRSVGIIVNGTASFEDVFARITAE